MDHGFPASTLMPPVPPAIIAAGARIVTAIHGGGHAVLLTGPDGSGKTTTLDTVLAGMPGWAGRVANRRPEALTLPRVLCQLGLEGGGAEALLRGLLARSGGAGPAVLVVDDAHTLDPAALAAMAAVPGLGGAGRGGMTLVLAGAPALLPMLGATGLRRLRPPAALLLDMGAPNAAPAPPPRAKLARRFPSWPWAAGAGGLLAAAGALLVLAPLAGTPSVETPLAPPSPPSARVDAIAVERPVGPEPYAMPTTPEGAQAPGPMPEPLAEPAAEPARLPRPAAPDAQLRREFDAFLDRAGRDTAQLTPEARQALFREYLQWRARPGP